MKNLLILILLFCVSTAYAKIDTVYTQQNGLVTMQILETPDKIMEEKSFKNTTPYTFTEQEIKTLMSGVTIKKPLGPKMETLFPPRFGYITNVISLENGATQQDQNTSEPKMSWLYLVFYMLLPAIFILWLSFTVPGNDRKQLLVYFLAAIALAVAFAPTVDFDRAVDFAVIVATVGAIASTVGAVIAFNADVAAGARLVSSGVIISVGAGTVCTADISLAIQYTVFMAVSCLAGYGLRQLYPRRKKKPTQALRIV